MICGVYGELVMRIVHVYWTFRARNSFTTGLGNRCTPGSAGSAFAASSAVNIAYSAKCVVPSVVSDFSPVEYTCLIVEVRLSGVRSEK